MRKLRDFGSYEQKHSYEVSVVKCYAPGIFFMCLHHRHMLLTAVYPNRHTHSLASGARSVCIVLTFPDTKAVYLAVPGTGM